MVVIVEQFLNTLSVCDSELSLHCSLCSMSLERGKNGFSEVLMTGEHRPSDMELT